MFSKPLQDNCLVFVFSKPKKVVLHMVFVFFPIDILFLDTNKKVVEVMENVKPFTPHILPKRNAKYIVELPSSTIKKTNTKVSHIIEFKKNI